MSKMISKRAAVRAGKKLNEMAEHFNERTVEGLRVGRLMTDREAQEATEVIRIANEIIYQYYAIPKDVRECWYVEVGANGVPVQDMAQE